MPLEGAALEKRTYEKLALVRNAEGELIVATAQVLEERFDAEELQSMLSLFGGTYTKILLKWDATDSDELYAIDVFRACFIPFHFFAENPATDAPGTFLELTALTHKFFDTSRHTAFIESMKSARYHFLLVEDLLPKSQVRFLDLETNERFVVTDYRLAEDAQKGFILLSALFQMWGDYYLIGALPFVLPGTAAPRLVSAVEEEKALVKVYREHFGPSPRFEEDLIRRAKFLATFGEIYAGESEPKMRNMEGHLIEELVGPYRLRCPAAEVLEILSHERLFDIIEGSSDTRLIWKSTKNSAASRKAGAQVSRGVIIVTSEHLYFEVNSEARANMLERQLDRILGDRITLQSVAAGRAPVKQVKQGETLDIESPEIAAIIQERLRQLSVQWVDSAIPALGGMTPREAAADRKMSGALEALLLSFEEDARARRGPGIATMDMALIRELLRKS